MKRKRHSPTLNQEFFKTLPLEIIIDILARLPVRTILNCKCVCKSLLSLINSDEFTKFRFSKSVPLLATYHIGSRSRHVYSILEVEVGLDFKLDYNLVTKVNLPNHRGISIHASFNGLLFLLDDKSYEHEVFVICNPVTREYVELPYPGFAASKRAVKLKKDERKLKKHEITYGFGACKITGKLKVVKIFKEWKEKDESECDCERYAEFRERHTLFRKHQCEVYTLGTGSWRRLSHAPTLKYYGDNMYGSFLNGNLHWLVKDKNRCSWISCFDLESEFFSTFSTPYLSDDRASLTTLGDYLCLCDNIEYYIVIWLMKKYGVEKSWTQAFVIGQSSHLEWDNFHIFYPIKVPNDGVLLIVHDGRFLVQYSKNGSFQVPYAKKNRNNLSMSCSVLFRHTQAFFHSKVWEWRM